MTRVRKLQERKQLQFENRQSEKKNTYLDNLQPAGIVSFFNFLIISLYNVYYQQFNNDVLLIIVL